MKIPCEIVLNANEYFPLSEIVGQVILTPSKSSIFNKLLIEVKGISECEWYLEKHLFKFPRIYTKNSKLSARDEFFISKHTLSKDNQEEIRLHKGVHTFGFSSHLPRSIPPTWTGLYGHIKYVATAILKIRNEYITIAEKELIVGCNRNLTLETHLTFEAREDVTRTFRLGFLNLGKVELSLWMPICGFGIGQHIPVLCTINNKSSIHFGGLIFVLTRIEIYKSKKPVYATKIVRTDICRIPRMVTVLKGKSDYYCVLETTINDTPTIQSPRTSTCQVIYEIWVSLQSTVARYTGYGYPNIDIRGLPIILGKYPFNNWDINTVSAEVMKTILTPRSNGQLETTPMDEEVEELLNTAEEEMDEETILNLSRQITRKTNVVDDYEDEESFN